MGVKKVRVNETSQMIFTRNPKKNVITKGQTGRQTYKVFGEFSNCLSQKNLTSNGCKPIGLLRKNLVYQYMYNHIPDYNIFNFEPI